MKLQNIYVIKASAKINNIILKKESEMKKFIYTLFAVLLSVALIQGCKKGEEKKQLEVKPGDVVKYAKYITAAYKDQEMKTWGATLSKTESVKLLETLTVTIKNAPVEVAKVKLSDNTVMFMNAKNLGDKPVVFTEDTKAFVRNNASSKVFAIIPKGTIGFVLQENAEWIQVYIGQVDGKWITQQWVNSGFTADNAIVQDARIYEEAAAVLAKADSKPDQKKQAEENLNNLITSNGIFADLARKVMNPVENSGGVVTPGNESTAEKTE